MSKLIVLVITGAENITTDVYIHLSEVLKNWKNYLSHEDYLHEFCRLIIHYTEYDYPFLTQVVSSNWGS